MDGTQCSQAMPLYLGLASECPNAVLQALTDNIAAHSMHLTVGMFAMKWMLLALATLSRNDLAFAMMTQQSYPGFGFMLGKDGPGSTIWESWFYSDNVYSHNHPMFGSVDQWLISSLA